MHNTAGLWHPISEGKLYKSAGSRTSFNDKWSRQTWHFAERDLSSDEHEESENDLESLQTHFGTGSC